MLVEDARRARGDGGSGRAKGEGTAVLEGISGGTNGVGSRGSGESVRWMNKVHGNRSQIRRMLMNSHLQFGSFAPGIRLRRLVTSSGKRVLVGSLSREIRDVMIHIRQKRIAAIRVLGSASMPASLEAGIGRFEPNSLRSVFWKATGDVW